MGKYLIFIACLLLTNVLMAQSELTIEQREKAEMCVERYFKMLARYANHPMGAEAAELRTDIIMMCENKFRTPVYNDLYSFKDIPNKSTACNIDGYLLQFGILEDKNSYTFQISYDSIVCHPVSVPTYADNYEYDNVFVYVNKHIEGDGKNVKIKNVIRLNLEKEEIAYIEKAEFDTNDKDIEFLLKHSLGYSPSKLNEVASRCYKEKKYKSALLLFEQSAIRDDMNSQYALANMLFLRQGCEEYGERATHYMAQFWAKKMYFKRNTGVQDSDYELLNGLMQKLSMTKFSSDPEEVPFNHGLMKYKEGDKYGFMRKDGEIEIPPQYTFAFPFSEGLACVELNGKFGHIDIKGKVVIPFKFDEASPFVNGVASVFNEKEDKMKEAFLINKSGKMVSDVYDYIGMWDSKGQLLTPVKQGEGWGFMNHDGIVKVPFIYENCTRSRSVLVNSLDLNYCWVKKDGKYGFYNITSENAKMVAPCKYLSTRSFSFGLAAVTEDGHKWFYIDYKGNKVCGDYAAVGNFRSDGMAFVKFDGSSNIGYFINPQGEIILICEEHEHKIYNLRRYNGNQK